MVKKLSYDSCAYITLLKHGYFNDDKSRWYLRTDRGYTLTYLRTRKGNYKLAS